MEKQKVTKEKWLIIIFAIILAIICFHIFLTGMYSKDTERIFIQGYTEYATKDAYIRDGRLFSAIIFVLIGLINPSIKVLYIIDLLISLVILSLCVLKIEQFIERYKKTENIKNKIITFILSFLYIFNFLMVDIAKFIDNFIICASIFLFLLSLENILIKNNKKIGFILALIGVFCYQGTIPMYIATAILITLLENKKIDKEYFKKILPCAVIIILATLINFIVVCIVPIITNLPLTNRLENSLINKIIYNIKDVIDLLFNTFYLFPRYAWATISLIIIIISYGYTVKNKNNTFFYVLFVFLSYILSIFVMLPMNVLERTTLPIGESISAMLIYMYCTCEFENENKFIKNSLLIVLIAYFILNVYSIINSTYQLKRANQLDFEFSKKIENKIEECEENGEKITKISLKYTGKSENYKKEHPLTIQDSLYISGLYGKEMYKFYTGKEIEREKNFSDEFAEKNFDMETDEEVQMKAIEDTLYILINF